MHHGLKETSDQKNDVQHALGLSTVGWGWNPLNTNPVNRLPVIGRQREREEGMSERIAIELRI